MRATRLNASTPGASGYVRLTWPYHGTAAVTPGYSALTWSVSAPPPQKPVTPSRSARPALLLGVVGSDRDVAEVLRPGHFAGDRAHLLEVLPLHPALALVELRRDRVVAGVREAPDHVLGGLTVTGGAGNHDDHG